MRFAVVLLVPSIALADQTFTLDGTAPSSGPDRFLVPFTVPDGTKEIEIFHDDLSPDNILDWGVYDPDGFRGYGGGNTENAVIGEQASSRSYLIGPIKGGTWQLEIGKAKITKTPADYKVTVTLRDAPTLAPQPERRPYTAEPALKSEARWYAGDFHTHSKESGDAKPELAAMVALAKARGLDFIELSDHNTTAQLDFYGAARSSEVLLLPGVEFTTYQGHANGIGATRFVDYKVGSAITIDAAAKAFHAQGALFSINHPTLEIGDLCIGCAWKHDLAPEQIDAVEIETGGWKQSGVLFTRTAIELWDALAAKGRHAAAIGGSDDHLAGEGKGYRDSPIGSPTTMVFANELSVRGILDGIRAGRTVVKLQDPSDPMIEMDAEGREGDTAKVKQTVIRAKVTGAMGQTFHWVKNGVAQDDVAIDRDPFTAELVEIPGVSEDRVRAEVYVDGAPRTITSHIFFQTGTAVFEPKMSASGGCNQAGASATALGALAALAILLRARRR